MIHSQKELDLQDHKTGSHKNCLPLIKCLKIDRMCPVTLRRMDILGRFSTIFDKGEKVSEVGLEFEVWGLVFDLFCSS